ncbi:MAG: AprI/Inh family metalloprotease inhibitor [Brevundimonas sp.]|uniref:AprI/Inh family metalloprotease inhibitor n=1 Tax=Brevundimonas sp. TaxID=1871086 RepID=UPI0027352EDD|nr:AprI/Inh family metalloprotease inhibitor [Brevundimonas sp.]MDP3404359.1 AprI/Inh family metalloprotease inhibitor [Brevundimonas sp.]
MSRDRSRVRAALAGAILMAGCVPPPATSEPQAGVLAVDQVAGLWSLRAVDGPARCDLALASLVIDGVRPVLAERCGVPAAVSARSWRAMADGFELLATDGAVLLAFRRTGEDAFRTADGRYVLSRLPLS